MGFPHDQAHRAAQLRSYPGAWITRQGTDFR